MNINSIMTRRLVLGACVGSALLMSVSAVAKDTDQQRLVNNSNTVFNAFLADKKMNWLRANIGKAKGVLIAPSIVKAGLIIGGSGGNAVLLVRGKDGKWAGPAFYNLGTSSIGFQGGVTESEMVALVMSQKAVDQMVKGSFKLGGEVSVAAGDGAGAESNLKSDVITYSRSKGIYGGVNFTGTGVSINKKWNEAFYGIAPAAPQDILMTRKIPAQPGAATLLASVVKAAK